MYSLIGALFGNGLVKGVAFAPMVLKRGIHFDGNGPENGGSLVPYGLGKGIASLVDMCWILGAVYFLC